jgi:hypothetical protein
MSSSVQHKPEASPASKATVVTGETDRTDSTPQTSQVPTGNLLDLEDKAEQTAVPNPAGTSADIPPVTPRQMMESSISPVLPPLPESLSG